MYCNQGNMLCGTASPENKVLLCVFSSVLVMFADMKSQTDTAGHSPFPKRQPYQPTSSAASSMMDAFLQEKAPPPSTSSSQPTPSTSLAQTVSAPKPSGPAVSQQQIPSGPSDPQASSPLPLQHHKLKHQKKRTSITTKASVLTPKTKNSTFLFFTPD